MFPSADRKLRLGVVAKYWQPGRVKTRLGKAIGMPAAALIHQTFCQHLSDSLATTAQQRSFVITPEESRSEFARAVSPAWEIEIQSSGDLGARMKHWFQSFEFQRRSELSSEPEWDQILIGADCPLLNDACLCQAGRLLHDHDVVLGPASDGGYYLIGLRGAWRDEYSPLLAAIPWSDPTVFELTCQRAQQSGLTVAVLAERADVDTLDDLKRLKHELGALAAGESRGLGERIESIVPMERHA